MRAAARRHYRAALRSLPGDEAPQPPPAAPYVAPTILMQKQAAALDGCAKTRGVDGPLMQQVRALYEEGVVPVREIAQHIGVSERTLYKYVQRGRWRRRYAHGVGVGGGADADEGDGGGAPCPPSRPVRGAGGRFIRRADAGRPHAHGLLALDPKRAEKAAKRCVGARRRVVEAAQAAERDKVAERHERAARRDLDTRLRAFDLFGAALVDLAAGYAHGGARYAATAGALQRLIDAEMRALLAIKAAP